jgi:hypothetical protein
MIGERDRPAAVQFGGPVELVEVALRTAHLNRNPGSLHLLGHLLDQGRQGGTIDGEWCRLSR